MSTRPTVTTTIRPDFPDFSDLPWERHLPDWHDYSNRLEQVHAGLSRHPVVFVNYDGELYAVKELPPGVARKEYDLLCKLEELRLPAVTPAGYVNVSTPEGDRSLLITRYLDHSLPYRILVMRSGLQHIEAQLLDAMAGLLIQLHLAGFFWGDCSLSNTLFRRDAGALQAYTVDAETGEVHQPRLSPTLRYHDLEIMEENVKNEILDLVKEGQVTHGAVEGISYAETGRYVRQRYITLWDEITREEIVSPEEHYRVQERIRMMNNLGFSVKQVEVQPTEGGDKLRLRVMVADRNFHRVKLENLTGLEAGERQATLMLNEITELQGYFSWVNQRAMPLSAAAYYWLERVYLPTLDVLRPLIEHSRREGEPVDETEFYIQILEHKWYLSEQAKHDVGHKAAAEDYLRKFLPA